MGPYITNRDGCLPEYIRPQGHDPLTGLANRELLKERLQQAIFSAQCKQTICAVFCLALDNFKTVNSCYGYDVGDEILRELAGRLHACARPGDTVARFFDDTFVVVVEELEQLEAAGLIGRSLQTAISAEPVIVQAHKVAVTASIGISTYPHDGTTVHDLLLHAEIAMHQAKQSGKNCCHFFTEQLSSQARRRGVLEHELRRAIEQHELVVYYQPKVALATGRITSAEALVRWQHPERGLISPAEFIPVAEETGLIEPLTDWVLHTACAQTQAWHAAGLPPLTIAVNISARQFRENYLQQIVSQVLRSTGLAPGYLELEITESALMQDIDQAEALLHILKQSGVGIALDDFGTGYSSLSYLKRFPVDKLKLDYSFVSDITSNSDSAGIARAVLAMAHSLKLGVIAEGVETESQLAYLRRQGYDEIQGYLVSRPVPADAFSRLLAEGTLPDGFAHRSSTVPDILIVDDDQQVARAMQRVFALHGLNAVAAASGGEALELLAQLEIPVLLTDNRMPGMSGIELARLVKELHPATVRIMITGYSDVETTIRAINEGAVFKFVTKPWEDQHLCATVTEALQYQRFLSETLKHQIPRSGETVYNEDD